MQTFADKVIAFNRELEIPAVPSPFEVMNPYDQEVTRDLSEKYFRKFYQDSEKRIFLFGINPGRFGSGVTGIGFTDPVQLEENCGIPNQLEKRSELSAGFIHQAIAEFGGVSDFYSRFFVTSVSPLGFLKNGKNANYYDDRVLQKALDPFIRKSIHKQIEFGAHRSAAICIGTGKNLDYLSKLNAELALFERIIPLSHPRFIMQYRRKRVPEFLEEYVNAFVSLASELS